MGGESTGRRARVPWSLSASATTGSGEPAQGDGAADPRTTYRRAATWLQSRYRALPADVPVRLAKPTSNLFRSRPQPGSTARLDARPFTSVVDIDPEARVAEVGGMTTYEDLVAATLPRGLMPAVVPQLKTITLGGALVGLGIESSSWRAGLVHETVREVDVLTGDGRLVTARPDGEHAALFAALPNSYGTLGYALRVAIDLQPVEPFVALEHVPFRDAAACARAIEDWCATGEQEGDPFDFLDGTWFAPDEVFLTVGRFTSDAPWTSDYTGQQIYYRSIRQLRQDHVTVHDYLWRWDTDWFWCSRAFGAQHPLVRRLWPRRWRRSDVYHRLVRLDQRYGISRRIDALRGRPEQEAVIQDVEVPVERLPDFLDALHELTGIRPVWVCPVRATGGKVWPLYPMTPGRLYVNVGFWSSVPRPEGQPDGTINRRLEEVVAELEGHKSLYSTSFYDEDEFWTRYNGDDYRSVKDLYDPDGRLGDPFHKCVHGG